MEGHSEVIANLLGQAALQIALRQAFEERSKFFFAVGHEGEDAIQEAGVRIGMIADFVDAAIEKVRRGDIKLPESVGLPRGERVGVHSLDICIGQQGEHFEVALRTDRFGEGANVLGVEDVAAHDERHVEVIANEGANGLAFLGVEVEAGEQAFGEFDAGCAMIAVAPRLAGIVQQQGEQEQVEAIKLRQQRREALIAVGTRLAQLMDVIYDEEGVFVDGIAMVRVADDECVYAVKFGDEQFKNAECVHCAQGVRSMRAEQNFAQAVPQKRALRHVNCEHW